MWSNLHAIDNVLYLYMAISLTSTEYRQTEVDQVSDPIMDLHTHLEEEEVVRIHRQGFLKDVVVR